MNKDDFKKIIDDIGIPDDKLENIKTNVLLKRKRFYGRYILISILAVILFIINVTMFHSPKSNKNDNDFISELYAYDQSFEFKEDKITFDVNDNLFANGWHSSATIIQDDLNNNFQVRNYVPLTIQMKGTHIKKISYTIEQGEDMHLYHLASSDLIAESIKKIKEEKDTYVLWRNYNDLRKQDIKKFEEIFQEECNKQNYDNHMRDLTNIYHQKINETNMSVQTIKDYGWIHFLAVDNNKKIDIQYNQQDTKNYKIHLAKVYTISKDDLEKETTEKQRLRTMKDSLIHTKIKISIEFENGIIKEKFITFKEVEVNKQEISPDEYGSRIYIEIQ